MIPTLPSILHTTAGDYPLSECRIGVGGREWAVAYTTAVVTPDDESKFFAARAAADNPMPYGVALWPAALAMAHEIATRAAEFRGKTVLELGAGTGLPGIVAASYGAEVVQTDMQELALHVCKLNGVRNGGTGIEYRLDDWEDWTDDARYDWILGSDVLYAHTLHSQLRRIFDRNLAPGGRVLVADPYRAVSLVLLQEMEADGWKISHSRWSIGEGAAARPVAVYELSPAGVLH